MGVCPAGDDVLPPFLTDRAQYLKDVVRPLLDKEETVYVVPKSDAEDYVARHFPNKHTKRVGNSLNRLRSISSFLFWLAANLPAKPIEGHRRHISLHLYRGGRAKSHGHDSRPETGSGGGA